MKKLIITKQHVLPSETEVTNFENKIGFTLPESYRSFLLSQNPKSVKESLIKIDGKDFWLEHFHPFNQEENGSLQYNYSLFCPDVLPKEYLSFAYDAGGWQFIICLDGIDRGKVFFCRMDEDFEDALTLLADDFEMFISEIIDVTDQSI